MLARVHALGLSAVLAVVAAGCLDINPSNGGWSCGANDACPRGYSCLQPQNVCWRDNTPLPPDLAGGGTGGGDEGDMATPPGEAPTYVPAVDHSSFTLTPNQPPLVANGKSSAQLSVTLKDAMDNAAFGIKVSFSTGSDRDHFLPQKGVSDANGTFTSVMTSEIGGDKTVTARVEWAGGTFDLTAPVTFTALPAATNSKLSVTQPRLAADGTSSTKITVLIKDGNGQTVSNASVKLAVDEVSGGAAGAQNKLTQDATTTDASGIVTGSLASTLASVKRINADVAFANDPNQSFLLSTDVTFDPIPNAGATVVVVLNNDIPADDSSTAALKVSVRDQNSKPVPGVKVKISSDDGQAPVAQTTDVANVDGEVTGTIKSKAAGAKTISANVSWSVDGVSGSFDVTGTTKVNFRALPSSANSKIVFSNDNVTANGVNSTTATITVKDFANAPIPGIFVTLAADDSFTQIDQPTQSTNAQGVATATIRATKEGAKKITASLSAATSVFATVTFSAVTVNSLKFATQPPAMSGKNLPTISVEAYDDSNVLIKTVPVAISMAVQAADGKPIGTVTFTGTKLLNTTPASGNAQFNDLAIDATDLPRTLQLVASGTLGVTRTQTSSSFTIQSTALPAPDLTLSVDGSDIVLSWTSVGSGVSYTVERKAPGDAAFGTATTVISTGATTAKDPALRRGTYQYHVKAAKAGVQGSVSADASGAPGTEVCVTHWDSSTKTGSIFIYAFKTDGTSKLMRTISGANTGMNYPYGIAYRASADELFVVNYLVDAGVTDFDRLNVFSRTANNNNPASIAPVRTLKLKTTVPPTAPGARQIALSSTELVVTENETFAVVGYPIGAANDDVPSWYLASGGTGINVQRPNAITIENINATNYRIFLGVGTPSNTIYGFERASINNTTHDVSSANIINSMVNLPSGLGLDPVNHELFVANQSANAMGVFNSISMANSPKRALLVGSATAMSAPVSVTFESTGLDGNVYILNNTNKSITKYSSQYTGNTAPDATVTGLPTGSLNGISVCN
ncbi:MAG: putative invasin [Myxococcales bacterium]|nr:putative invasin [Myxococcales bacterium]